VHAVQTAGRGRSGTLLAWTASGSGGCCGHSGTPARGGRRMSASEPTSARTPCRARRAGASRGCRSRAWTRSPEPSTRSLSSRSGGEVASSTGSSTRGMRPGRSRHRDAGVSGMGGSAGGRILDLGRARVDRSARVARANGDGPRHRSEDGVDVSRGDAAPSRRQSAPGRRCGAGPTGLAAPDGGSPAGSTECRDLAPSCPPSRHGPWSRLRGTGRERARLAPRPVGRDVWPDVRFSYARYAW